MSFQKVEGLCTDQVGCPFQSIFIGPLLFLVHIHQSLQFPLLAAEAAHIVLSVLPVCFQLFDFRFQPGKDIVVAGETLDEFLLPAHPVFEGFPVDILEIVDGEKPCCRISLFIVPVTFCLHLPDMLSCFFPVFGQLVQFFGNENNLFLVRKAQHIMTAVVDTVAVILLVPFPLGFDLPLRREGEGCLFEIGGAFCADMVKAVIQLPCQPGGKGRVLLDIQLPGSRFGRKVRHAHRLGVFFHPVVHNALMEKMVLHPADDLFVEGLRHQHGHAEFRQQSFQGTFPFLFLRLHFHDFTGKGHIAFRHHQVRSQLLSDGHEPFRNIGIPLLQRFQFHAVLADFFNDFSFFAVRSRFLCIQTVILLLQLIRQVRQLLPSFDEFIQRRRQRKAQGICQHLVFLRLLGNDFQVLLVACQVLSGSFQTGAAVFPHFLLLVVDFIGQMAGLILQRCQPAVQIPHLAAAFFQLLRQDFDFLSGQVGSHTVGHKGKLRLLCQTLIIAVRRRCQRLQDFHLLPVPDDGIVNAL